MTIDLKAWLGLVLALSLAGPDRTVATTYTIATTVDDATDNGNCTLREAIRAAVTGTSVDTCPAGEATNTIQLADGTYPFAGQESVDANTSLEILSLGTDPAALVVDLQQAGRFISQIGGSLTLKGFTVRNGSSSEEGGTISSQNGSLALDRMRFSDSASQKSGGAIDFVAAFSGFLRITRTTFSGNSAVGIGGALRVTLNSGPVADLRDLTFAGNTVNEGAFFSGNAWGGGALIEVDYGSSATCVRCAFSSNAAVVSGGEDSDSASGGGAHLLAGSGGGAILFTDGSFLGNSSSGHSLFLSSAALSATTAGSSYMILDRLLVDQSQSTGDGPGTDGLLFASGGSIYLSNSRWSRGEADGLTAVKGVSSDLRIHQVTVAGYDTGIGLVLESAGAGIWLANSLLALNATDTSITGNVLESSNCIAMGANFPSFVDGGTGNYRLTADSAAVDAGEPGLNTPRFADLDHGPRLAGTGPDCGAYEYGGLFADDFEVGDAGAWSTTLGLDPAG